MTNKTKNTTQYVLDDTIQKTKDEDKQNKKTQHNMCWTPPYTRLKMKTNKTKHTTQYELDDTIQKTKYEDQQNKKDNTICAGHHHTQDKRGRQTNQKTQHNMCWTPPCTRQKTKTSKTKHTTQYVLDDTIQKTKDEDKRTKKHNTICVGHHHAQDKRRRQAKQNTQHNMCWTTPYTR
jgi:hypothetical protein